LSGESAVVGVNVVEPRRWTVRSKSTQVEAFDLAIAQCASPDINGLIEIIPVESNVLRFLHIYVLGDLSPN